MRSVLGLSTCLLLTAALAACNKSEPAAPAATTATPAIAPAAADAQAPAAPTPVAAPAAEDAAPVALDMGKVKAWMEAQKNLALLEKADPKLDAAQNESEENVTQYAARLEANAKMRAAIEQAGLSTRDFARIGDTLIGAMMTEAALKGGQLKKVPDGIDPASVEFVKQHDAEIKKLMAGMGAS
jgi:hypothetical protein